MRTPKLLVSLAALATGLTSPSSVFAQDVGAPPGATSDEASADETDERADVVDETGAGDIIVTATRNETLASKTPVSLTAIAGENLDRLGITDPTELDDIVPNLSMDRLSNSLQITIRGVTSTDTTEKGDPSAAFMQDGVYIARPHAQEVSFFDLERVEVLRGPQGTLFGRNSTAGVVQVISNKPKDRNEASLSLTYGNFDTQRVTGMVNVPITEAIAVRAAFNYDHRDNFVIPGPRVTAEIDPFKENISGRLSGRAAWDGGRLIVLGDYSHLGGHMFGIVNPRNFYTRITTPGVDPIYSPIGDERTRRTALTPMPFDNDRNNGTWGVTADAQHDVTEWLTINYVGGFRHFWRDEELPLVAGTDLTSYISQVDVEVDQWSHEVRLAGELDALQIQGGLYYFKEEGFQYFSIFGLVSPTPGVTGYNNAIWVPDVSAESRAAFAQGTLSLTDDLRLTAGVRYSEDHKARSGTTTQCSTALCNAPTDRLIAINSAERDFSKVTWRLGIDYDLNDRSLLYAIVSTGYKAGGFNSGCERGTGTGCLLSSDGLYYRPESNTAYEIGAKVRLLDNLLGLNIAAFHYDVEDIQLGALRNACGGTPCNVTTNAGRAKIDGAELEGILTPFERTRLDLALSWLNARFAEFNPNPTTDWKGRSLDHAPEWTISAGLTQSFEMPGGAELIATARSKFVDDSVISALGTLNQYPVPDYTRTDLNLTYQSPDGRWTAEAFANNLENRVHVSAVFPGALSSLSFSDPRTYGIRLSWKN